MMNYLVKDLFIIEGDFIFVCLLFQTVDVRKFVDFFDEFCGIFRKELFDDQREISMRDLQTF